MTHSYFTYKQYPAKNAHRTLFFFPAGFTKLSLYRYTIRQLNKMGVTVVGFDFKWNKAVKEVDLEGLNAILAQVDGIVSDHMADNKIRAIPMPCSARVLAELWRYILQNATRT